MVCLLHWTGATQTAGQQDSRTGLAKVRTALRRGDRRVWHNRLALAEASEQARHGETWGDTAWKLGRVACAMLC